MQMPTGTSDTIPHPASLPDTLRNFHKKHTLDGDPPNAILSLNDDLFCYLIAAIQNIPCTPPMISIGNWQNFLTLCQPHGIIPLIAFHVRTWPEEYQPPQEIMDSLNRIFLYAAARNLRAGRQIQVITNALKDAGIPVILLKGHALARTVYPDPALRQSCDIDLLIQPHNIPASEEVLEKLGYVCPVKNFYVSRHAHPYEIFFPPTKGLDIDLHWTTDNAFSLFPEGWLDDAFSRRIPITSGDLSCDTFSHPDNLLYLAFHDIFKHEWLRLDRIYDAALLMKCIKKPEDWKELSQQSADYHIRISMELLITAACLWDGCELPTGTGN
ncbi:MAG: nucleotidyltransferase family protein [Methanoregula sp.]|nr:nucleotidyltransferase family protein [Methanoregula sp.]